VDRIPLAQITAWRVLSKAIVSKDNLLRHGISPMCDCCPLCGVEKETVSHLFFCVRSLGEFWDCVLSGWGFLRYYIVMHKCTLNV